MKIGAIVQIVGIDMNNHKMQEKHNRLAITMQKYGEHYPKKHGTWVRYKLVGNIYLTMDSWNKAIRVTRNAKFDNRWTGFSGDDIAYLGIDFGGYEPHVEEKVLDNILNKISTSY
jgi:hypothetical protein